MHVVQRGVNRSSIFADDVDRINYLGFLCEAADKHECAVHCYVLMGNHVHLLVTPSTKESLPKTMQSVNVRYVWRFNRRHERTGPLFEGRYYDSRIESDGYLQVCFIYVEQNPVRAGLCNTPCDYRWSSHRHHACGQPDQLITPHECYQVLGTNDEARQMRYRRWFSNPLSEKRLDQIRSGVRHQDKFAV